MAVLDQANTNRGMIPAIPAAMFNVNEADAAWVDSMSVPQPLSTFVEGVRAGVDSSPGANRTFVFAAANGGDWFVSTHLRLKDHPNWKVHEIACGHNIMLDRPLDFSLATAGRSDLMRIRVASRTSRSEVGACRVPASKPSEGGGGTERPSRRVSASMLISPPAQRGK